MAGPVCPLHGRSVSLLRILHPAGRQLAQLRASSAAAAGHRRWHQRHAASRGVQRQAVACHAVREEEEAGPSLEDKLEAIEDGIGRHPHILSPEEERQALEAVDLLQVEEAAEEGAESVALFVGAALAFGAGVWAVLGSDKGAEFFAGYLLEQSLSIDNLFVFILVFSYFKTPVGAPGQGQPQSKVLTYGILSAAVLRLVMILVGAELIENFQPVLLGFAGILLWSSYKLLAAGGGDEDEDLQQNSIVRLCRRFIKVSDTYDGDKFFTVQNGVKTATPLLLVLAVIEISDVVFAVDSIPAVFGVTKDPFIVYTSNMFAILSLRALYGFVATVMSRLQYLDKAVALVLGFIGAKMVADYGGLHLPTEASLGVVAALLGAGVAASLLAPSAADDS